MGLAVINDIFYEHQRGLKVGLWVLAADMGLLVGPPIGGFMDLVNHFWISWLTAILSAAILIAEVFFFRETLYPRNRMLRPFPYADGIIASAADIEKTARRLSVETEVALKRAEMFAFINVNPIQVCDIQNAGTLSFALSTLLKFSPSFRGMDLLLRIVLVDPLDHHLHTLCLRLVFAANTRSATHRPYPRDVVFCWLTLKLAKKNKGARLPAMRLLLTYLAVTFNAIGLIIWGIRIDRAYHWIMSQVAFFLFSAEIQMEPAIASYTIDYYPLQSMSMVTFYALKLNLSAFC